MSTILEVAIRFFWPPPMLFPRADYVPRYGLIYPPQTIIHHQQRGTFYYRYTINQGRYRGNFISPDHPGLKIVTLGDSYTFGTGVQDQETYSQVLNRLLGDRYVVINLGTGYSSLGQQIARFLHDGLPSKPFLVILQFCNNDVPELALFDVVKWENQTQTFLVREQPLEQLVFIRRLLRSLGPLYRLLASRSALFRFVELRIYLQFDKQQKAKALSQHGISQTWNKSGLSTSAQKWCEERYSRLLERFTCFLNQRQIRLFFMSVQGHLSDFPHIKETVLALEQQQRLDYLETADWFSLDPAYQSPEGHLWGRKGHAEIARGLYEYLLETSLGPE